MVSRYRKLGGKPRHVIILGLGLAALFWGIDAVVDSLVFKEGPFVEILLFPSFHASWERLLFIVILGFFVGYVISVIRSRDSLAEELGVATQKAEQERARSEAIIAAIGDGMSIQDTDFRVLYQNDRHKELVGGDFTGRYCYEAYSCRDEVCPECPIAMCYRDGHVHTIEKVAPALGEGTHIAITASPLRDADGSIIAGIELVRDMTRHKQVEEALERNARFLQKLIDTIPNPIFYKDARFRFIGCNAAFEECIGLAKHEVLGKTFHELIPAELAEGHHRKDVELMAHPGVQVYETSIACATGCQRDVIMYKATYAGADTAPAGIVGVVVDITERKRFETKLKESEERFRNLVESTSDWVWEIDENGVYMYASPRIRDLLGYEPEEMIGRTPFDFIPADEAARIRAFFAGIASEHKPFNSLESTNRHKDGRMIVLETSGVPIFDGEGNFRGYRGIDRDITERKRVEEEIRKLNEDLSSHAAELAAANRELEEFSSSVSHDLRSHLTRIYSAGQLVLDMSSSSLDETGKSLVSTICEGCETMEDLIQALLTLSRVTRSEMRRTECNLSELADVIAAELRVTEPERQVQFTIEPGLKDFVDPRLLRALLENLLGNAWKYSRKTPEAHISFVALDFNGERVYCVRDNGAGFDMEKSDLLFEPFQRLHSSGEFSGTGVGLATVKRIVKRHGGRVWGEGAVGRGASFFFTLK